MVVKYLLKRFSVSGFVETFERRRPFELGISDETFERATSRSFQPPFADLQYPFAVQYWGDVLVAMKFGKEVHAQHALMPHPTPWVAESANPVHIRSSWRMPPPTPSGRASMSTTRH